MDATDNGTAGLPPVAAGHSGSAGGAPHDDAATALAPTSSAGQDSGAAATRDAGSGRADAGSAAASDDDEDAAAAEPDQAPAAAPREWIVSEPRQIGLLVGRDASYAAQAGLMVYGTDLGFSFEHDGRVVMLFGDTYGETQGACNANLPRNDDMVATLPLEYQPGVPGLQALTEPAAPQSYRPIQLFRNDTSVVLDAFKVPVAGFSDGADAYAIFQSQEPVRCDATDPGSCGGREGVQCAPQIPLCKPAPITVPKACELLRLLCLGPDCAWDECVDTHSSQYDGSPRGNASSALSVLDIAKARAGDLATYDSVATWQTNSFSHPTVRQVTRFSGTTRDNDYRPGHGALLIWGRSGMVAEEGREARVYLASQTLPLGAAGFAPRYYAGVDPQTNEPRWSDDAAQAQPLALDGQPGGDPHEAIAFVGTTGVSWLGAPINRWVMMYGGDVADFMLFDPIGTRDRPDAGSIVMRFADQPWGPWSPPLTHLRPGSPNVVGDMYGPGGILYHPECVDQGAARCAPGEPYALSALGMCISGGPTELGRLYAPNIIDAYTRPNPRGGLDISWVVSTWAPYSIAVFETSFDPAP